MDGHYASFVGNDGYAFIGPKGGLKRGLYLDDDESSSSSSSLSLSSSYSSREPNHSQAKKNKRVNRALFERCGSVAARILENRRGGWSVREIQEALFGAAIEYWQKYQHRYFEDEEPHDKARDISRDEITEDVLMKLMTVGTYSVDPVYATNTKGVSHRPALLATLPVRFTDTDFEEATIFEFIEIVSLNFYLNMYAIAWEKMGGV
tara:strand:- start:1370 stop:1987 length:618 start_codon:yes stop_codon:yes gene_type:complete